MIYEPREDSFLLVSQVKKLSKNKKVLDIGSGSGIQALAALSAKAKSVLASDIDTASLDNIKSKGIQSIKSDLFSKIRGKFELIIFNPPYLPFDSSEDKESKRATTGGKSGDEIILRFLQQVQSHLAPKGSILLLMSSLTPKDKILLLMQKLSLEKKVLCSEKFFFETLEVWKIKKSIYRQFC